MRILRTAAPAVFGFAAALAGMATQARALDQKALEQVISLQILKVKKCLLVRLDNVTELRLFGGVTIQADAYCSDGRVYTVSQEKPHAPYKFTPCPTRC